MRCTRCKSWLTPDLGTCPQCAAPVANLPTGASLVDAHRRNISATRKRWQGRGESEPRLAPAAPEISAAKATSRAQINAELSGPLNLLRLHSGLSPLRRLEVELGELSAGHELFLEADPAVVRPWSLPLSGGLHQNLDPPAVEPDPSLFPDDETSPGELSLKLMVGGRPVGARRLQTAIEPADLWHATPGEEPVLAGVVTPNAPVLSALLSGLEGDVMAYRTPDGRRLRQELEAVGDVVRGLGLRYAVASPAWGGSRGQRVMTPERALASRRVCCLDLAVLWASLLERLGMHPLILLIAGDRSDRLSPGHAICGVWTADIRSRQPVLRDVRVLEKAVGGGDLLLFDPTLPFAGVADHEFSSALAAGSDCLARRPIALDLAACRSRGLTPLPRRRR